MNGAETRKLTNQDKKNLILAKIKRKELLKMNSKKAKLKLDLLRIEKPYGELIIM